MHRISKYILLIVNVLLLTAFFTQAQYQKPYEVKDAGEIKLALEKANNLGSVLYLAAHPDDENTELLAYLNNELNFRTAYLSLTRGDGGQNLIGSEKGRNLGVLRSQELMGARSVDGALQFFSRANDFGFSKTTKGTLDNWGETRTLSDIVWVIRKFKPDAIITRFPSGGYEDAHGHHTASAYLAEKAFKAAGNPDRFPEQLNKVDPWEPTRLLFNTSYYFYQSEDKSMDSSNLIATPMGTFNNLIGHSYVELGAKSSSFHKSQGFGQAPDRGGKLNFLSHTMGDKNLNGILAGIKTGWNRLENGNKVGKHVDRALSQYDPQEPQKIIPDLVKAYQNLDQLTNDHWRSIKRQQLKKLILAANGCWLDATADSDYGVPGQSVEVKGHFLNRNEHPITVKSIEFPFGNKLNVAEKLKSNNPFEASENITIPESTPFTQPYWLREPMLDPGMYQVPDQSLVGLPETPTPMKVTFNIQVNDIEFAIDKEVRYKWEDRVKGEQYKPFEIGPPATLHLVSDVTVFPDQKAKTVKLKVKARQDSLEGTAGIQVPDGWETEPSERDIALNQQGAEKTLQFTVKPPQSASNQTLKAYFKHGGDQYNRSIVNIDYEHIPDQTLFPKATMKIVRENIKAKGQSIGYIMGTGDEIPGGLKQLGYEVTMINDNNWSSKALSDFDAIVIGVRAYNTKSWLALKKDDLMNYVKNGGNLVVQYNKDYSLVTEDIGPYPFSIADKRVTVKDAEVNFLAPEHTILNKPNDITQADFNNWVQERGLYFPGEWDDAYTPLLSCHDPGEEPLKGGLLFTEYGKGAFMYTGYTFFRQLPAGNPGAFKLFSNLVSYGN